MKIKFFQNLVILPSPRLKGILKFWVITKIIPELLIM